MFCTTWQRCYNAKYVKLMRNRSASVIVCRTKLCLKKSPHSNEYLPGSINGAWLGPNILWTGRHRSELGGVNWIKNLGKVIQSASYIETSHSCYHWTCHTIVQWLSDPPSILSGRKAGDVRGEVADINSGMSPPPMAYLSIWSNSQKQSAQM